MKDKFKVAVGAVKAISPIDGRYRPKVGTLALYFSEEALIKYRIKVELTYLLFLSEKGIIKKITTGQKKELLSILDQFGGKQALRVKEIEATINHDVKAVEYFLREALAPFNLNIEEYIHFGLTSEDTNSLALSLSIKEARDQVILPAIKEVVNKLSEMVYVYRSLPMLGRTHGQPAIPTTVGKEFLVFTIRLQKEMKNLSLLPIEAKLNGAVGNFNAHLVGFPEADWIALSAEFIKSLNLVPNQFTTQILPADSYLRLFQSLSLINSIIIGLDQDIWRYISDNYFLQKPKKGEVGSSTMPQKVNPIDFENSEGNLEVANAIFGLLVKKLAISRLQRDLSDSTVKRNIGVAFAHSLVAYKSSLIGLEKVIPNESFLREELLDHWEIVTEGIQTILKSTGDSRAYEKLKEFARGKKLGQGEIKNFTSELKVSPKIKKRILALTPLNYLGLAETLVEKGLKVTNFEFSEETNENKKK